ncbi:ethanolamine permease [Thermoleptolyngbya sichuanensis A183]|uniref:Ethanolamine permease n=1 Tax=Thermoleptolyngbya sichuanensis A183 TaxID=2737172 RepID=A0A6M8BN63_9CYAN|nr:MULTISPECIES: ethanolamine permease [Thermoleptolyngbya]QKD83745.1 ethanolamine permease [Thermoleptolyngbya sichuanensis A183]
MAGQIPTDRNPGHPADEGALEAWVSYEPVEAAYFQKRQLRRSVGWGLLWALGVGAVISGNFSGWNFGLAAGGFGGMAIATLLTAVLYICLVYTISELSAALPHAGGFYSFVRHAFGPLGGFLSGITDLIEYLITPALIAFFIGAYLNSLFPAAPPPIWWLLFYAIFVGINILGVEPSLKVGLVFTVIALAVLVDFYLGAVLSGKFQPGLLLNIAPTEGNPAWLPNGVGGIFGAIPYAIWFFLAIEQLPLSAEEATDSRRDIPRALLLGIATLLVFSLLTLVLNSGVPATLVTADTNETFVGAAAIARTTAPLADGLRAVFGEGTVATRTLTFLALTGLIASFHAVIYAYSRSLFALSRAGYLPRWISVTSQYRTPAIALLVGAAVGLLCIGLIELAGQAIGPALLNMVVFGAVLSYILVFASYLKLKRDRPELYRPYLSPLGSAGAWVGLILSIVALVASLADPNYRPGIRGVLVVIAILLAYFFLYSRRRLVSRAPEEETALLLRVLHELR